MTSRNLAARSIGAKPASRESALLILPRDQVKVDDLWWRVYRVATCDLSSHQQPCVVLALHGRTDVHAAPGSMWWTRRPSGVAS